MLFNIKKKLFCCKVLVVLKKLHTFVALNVKNFYSEFKIKSNILLITLSNTL